MGEQMRKSLLISVSAFVLGAGTMAWLDQPAQAIPESRVQTYHMLQLFGDVLDTVEHQYVTPVDDKKLIEAALKGMLTSLDPHSDYLDPADYAEMQDMTRGEYGGLGIEITSEDSVVKIISPIDGTPASRAGLKPGDYITAVNGESVLGLSVSDAVKQMRGKVGEKVTLTIARDKVDPFDVTLVREIIQPKSVTSKLEGDYGYVRLASFNEKATDETEAAIKGLEAKDPHMKGLVLDLRNNPGGLLDQAVGVANLFLDGGEIVSQRGRDTALHRAVQRQAGGQARLDACRGADQQRHRLRGRDRRRRPAGPPSRRARRTHQLRQGLGPDGDPVARRPGRRAQGHDRALLHAVGPLDSEDRHRTGPRGRGVQGPGRAGRQRGVPVQRGQLPQRAGRRRGQGAQGGSQARRSPARRLRREEGRLPARPGHGRAQARLGGGHAQIRRRRPRPWPRRRPCAPATRES